MQNCSANRKMKENREKSNILFVISNNVFIFAAEKKIIKDNEYNDSKYILVVAPVTTPTVVREQCSYVYTSLKI